MPRRFTSILLLLFLTLAAVCLTQLASHAETLPLKKYTTADGRGDGETGRHASPVSSSPRLLSCLLSCLLSLVSCLLSPVSCLLSFLCASFHRVSDLSSKNETEKR